MNKSSENELSKFSFGFLQQRILWIGSMSVGGSSRITSLGNMGKPYRLNGHFAIFNFALNNRASSYRFMIFINRPFLGHTFHIRNWPAVVNRGFSPYSTFCRTHFFRNKKGVVSFALTIAAGYHTLDSISTNDPRTKLDVSIRLTLESLESGSFSNENKRRKHRKASAAKMLAFSLPSRRCFYNLKISGRSEPFGTGLCQYQNSINLRQIYPHPLFFEKFRVFPLTTVCD